MAKKAKVLRKRKGMTHAEILVWAQRRRERTSLERKAKINYLREYRKEHSEEIAAEQRGRYKTDPVYREKCKERARRAYKKKQEAIRAMRSRGILPKVRTAEGTTIQRCPVCYRPLPRRQKPVEMVVAKQYQVLMIPIGELSRHIGKSVMSLKLWIKKGIMPEANFKTKAGFRLWTQDQVEVFMRVCVKHDLRPPVSYERIGFVAELKHELSLLPHGINPALYTVRTERGLLKRPDQELPVPLTQKYRKGRHRAEAETEKPAKCKG